MEPRVLEQLTLPQLVNEFVPFHGTQDPLVFRKASHLSPSWAQVFKVGLFPSNFFQPMPSMHISSPSCMPRAWSSQP